MHAQQGTTSGRGVFAGEVVENRLLCREHYRLRLRLERFPSTRPGQFIQVRCRGDEAAMGVKLTDWPEGRLPRLTQSELRDTEAFLRRPVSLAGRTDGHDGVTLTLIYRVVGTGTRWLAGLGLGDALSVLGPLGNGFAIRDAAPRAVLVGGGVGIPPLIYLAQALAAAGRRTVAFCGARSAEALPLTLVPGARVTTDGRPTPCIAEFATAGAAAVVATDNGTLGYQGFISDAFTAWLAWAGLKVGQTVVYCCGPEPMMQVVAAACIAAGIECQLALERHMACGMGTCQSCVVKTAADSAEGWKFSLCCTDGPVFDARDVLW